MITNQVDGQAVASRRSWTRTKVVMAALVACLSLAVVATTGAGAAKVATKKPIIIPIVMGLTGAAAPFGGPQLNGAHMAVNNINAAGGIDGHKLRLLIRDDQSSATASVTLTRQLAPNYPFVVISTLSTNAAQDFPVLAQLKVPGLDPALSVEATATTSQPWTFSTSGQLSNAIGAAVKQWVGTAHPSSVAVVYNQSDAASTSQATLWETAFIANSITVPSPIAISSTTVDYGPAIAAALASNPSAVLVSALPAQAAAIIQLIHQQSPTTQLLESTAAVDLHQLATLAPQGAPGVLSVVQYDGNYTAASKKFAAQYYRNYGEAVPNQTVASEYTLINILANAAKSGIQLWSNSSKVRNQIKSYFNKLNYSGPFGVIKMVKGKGYPMQTQFFVQITSTYTETVLKTVLG